MSLFFLFFSACVSWVANVVYNEHGSEAASYCNRIGAIVLVTMWVIANLCLFANRYYSYVFTDRGGQEQLWDSDYYSTSERETRFQLQESDSVRQLLALNRQGNYYTIRL